MTKKNFRAPGKMIEPGDWTENAVLIQAERYIRT